MSLYVEIFEFPDRFFVEANNPDRDYREFFPGPYEVDPHFVDLEVYETGKCSCRDFEINIEPYIPWNNTNRRTCIHIRAAQAFRRQFTIPPTPMPLQLWPTL